MRDFRLGEAAALTRYSLFDSLPDTSHRRLADAQRMVVCQRGFASWSKLKQHVEAVSRASDDSDELVGSSPETKLFAPGGIGGSFAELTSIARHSGMWPQSRRQVTCPIAIRDSWTEHFIAMPPMICSIVRWTARATALLVAAGFLTFIAGEPIGSLRVIQVREWAGMVLLVLAVAGMLLAWRWEFPSALISMAALGAFVAVVHMQNHVVLAIATIPNILFLLDWKLRRPSSAPISPAG